MENIIVRVMRSTWTPGPKFCVFCGRRPINKSPEHIVPKWLMKLTVGLKHQINFGPFWNDKTKQLETRQFSCDNLQFPACYQCNQKYSTLEDEVIPIMEALLNQMPLAGKDFSTLLTWLDKLRIGLDLGVYYFNRKIAFVRPQNFIDSRLDRSDRAVLIYRSNNRLETLILLGSETLAFQMLPSCFALLVNNLALFNISTDFLFSRRIGLPYPEESWWDEDENILYNMARGKHRVMKPLIRRSFNTKCVQLYQPMLPEPDIRKKCRQFYNDNYVKSITMDLKKGIGKVFNHTASTLKPYPDLPSHQWVPKDIWDAYQLQRIMMRQTLKYQIAMLDDFKPKDDHLNPERKKKWRKAIRLTKEFNTKTLKRYLNIF